MLMARRPEGWPRQDHCDAANGASGQQAVRAGQ